jgi:hypothetical protein
MDEQIGLFDLDDTDSDSDSSMPDLEDVSDSEDEDGDLNGPGDSYESGFDRSNDSFEWIGPTENNVDNYLARAPTAQGLFHIIINNRPLYIATWNVALVARTTG